MWSFLDEVFFDIKISKNSSIDCLPSINFQGRLESASTNMEIKSRFALCILLGATLIAFFYHLYIALMFEFKLLILISTLPCIHSFASLSIISL